MILSPRFLKRPPASMDSSPLTPEGLPFPMPSWLPRVPTLELKLDPVFKVTWLQPNRASFTRLGWIARDQSPTVFQIGAVDEPLAKSGCGACYAVDSGTCGAGIVKLNAFLGQQLRKVSRSLSRSEYSYRTRRAWVIKTLPLVINKEEELILEYGTAEGCSEHVPA